MASNSYHMNPPPGTSGQPNPFIKIIEQEFMHTIDKTPVPTHVLSENTPQENEEGNEGSDGGSDMEEEIPDEAALAELANQSSNWPHKAVLLLIELYRKHLPKFNSKNIKKKGVWNLLAQEMRKKGFDVNGEACDKKFRALKHRYKVILEGLNSTGRRNRKWEYFELMAKLLVDDPAFKASMSSVSDSNEEEEEEPQDEDPSSKNHVIWTHPRKLLLLKLCRDHRHDDQASDVWKTVSDELKEKGCDISPDVCEKKFRYFKYRYKKVMESDDPIREGNKWVYFEIMKSLLDDDSIFKSKSTPSASSIIIPPFKIVNSNPDDIVSKSLIKSFKQEHLEETNENAHEESEELGNGNEGRGDVSDNYMMEELEDGQEESISGAYVPTVWTHRAILMLIKLYKVHVHYFKSPNMKKSDVWKMISTKMEAMGHSYGAEACDKKFRCLKYRYSKIIEDGNSNGRGKKWQYFQAMQAILENDPEYEPIKIVSTMALPPDGIEDHSSSTSTFAVRRSKRSSTISTFKIRGTSPLVPPPRKRLRTSIYDEPPSWFIAFVESQNRHMEEVKALQKSSMKIAKERNAILRSFTDVLLKKLKVNK